MSTEAKCNCQYCNGHIAFSSEMAGQMSACPHCGQETKLYVAATPNDIPVEVKRNKIYFAIVLIIVGIVAFAVYRISFSGHFVEWSKSPVVTQGDINVAVRRISVPSGFPIEITLSVANLSATKKVNFTGWSGMQLNGSSATLTDNNNNNYKHVTDGVASDSTIYPQQEISDAIRFETPVDNIQWLHLELPAKNFGGSGMLRFEFSIDKIKAAREEVRKAQAAFDSFQANPPYLTNADYVKLANEKNTIISQRKVLEESEQAAVNGSLQVTPYLKKIIDDDNTKLSSQVSQLNELDSQLSKIARDATVVANSKLEAAKSILAAAETNLNTSLQ